MDYLFQHHLSMNFLLRCRLQFSLSVTSKGLVKVRTEQGGRAQQTSRQAENGQFLHVPTGRYKGSISASRDRRKSADSVEKVGFSVRLNSGTATTGEPTHHIEWFLGPSLTFAALLLG
ncbi:hypothetical protein IMF27_18930 [Pseudomonas sp. PCH199]|uniref:hypothetical protein n=1 Tax=unclassified Pseudomonas TaxID=196821 RepID=UPI000FFC9E05|nr:MULTISPECIES: hypothetical protein [unclassified Pseudomonas]MCW8277448.1 hypothetical protein [Pseudomonas sp. PCH199]